MTTTKNTDEDDSLKKKIGAWLNDRDNHEGDLIDFLCDECGVEISSPPSDEEDEEDEDREQCNDCKIEAKKHCDVCGGYGSEEEEE
tara:strand:- start:162 stop:419 length:258 start_codon:yes stop_codon:yes gene_type:complete